MSIHFSINEVPYSVNLATLPPDITLNTFIREHAQLTATKFMCLEGGCGACVCVVRGTHPGTGKERTWAVNSCLTLLNTCIDLEITTSEGIGGKRIGYHPIQTRLARLNGSQCGYCSPGFVMNMYGLLESKDGKVTMEEVENSFGGNLCRCTGYRPILDAMKSFAQNSDVELPPLPPGCTDCTDIEDLCAAFSRTSTKREDVSESEWQMPLTQLAYDNGTVWHWPNALSEVFDVLDNVVNEEYMLVGGNTAHGVYRRSPNIKHFIDINGIAELKEYSYKGDKLILGGSLTLSEAMDIFLAAAQRPGFEYCSQLWRHFDLIANVPVRNKGTLAGNISIKKAHPEFPSDIFLTFETLAVAVVVAESTKVRRSMTLLEYVNAPLRKVVLTAFELKAYPKPTFVFQSYKITPRAQNAHAYVNAGFLLNVVPVVFKVLSARICFGGIRPDFVHAAATEKLLVRQFLLTKETTSSVFNQLSSEIQPDDFLPDASPEYRRTLAISLFYKFVLSIAPKVKDEYRSGGQLLARPLSFGSQSFQTIEKNFPITQPVQKLEALIQCAGEAIYMNDIPTGNNTVYCAFVNATKVGATIEQVDATEALRTPGVLAFYSVADIPGVNSFTDTSVPTIVTTEEIFCSGRVLYYDQPLGVIVATTSDIAYLAASKVKTIYSYREQTLMMTAADVLAANARERVHRTSKSPLKAITFSDKPDISGRGIFEVGSQYHFTMEPQTTIVIPFEDGLNVWCATQWMDHTQLVIAKMLGVQVNNVPLHVRRLGGAYGAKITRGNQVACAAALVASKLRRPVRFVQRIEHMMSCNGKRWACLSDYEFHAKYNGKIVALRNTFFEDAGNNLNENPIEVHTLPKARSCYQFTSSNLKLDGNAVITDAASSTFCRAPGGLEGIAMIENIMEHIAFEAKLDPADVRLVNIIPGHKLQELLPRFTASTEYRKRRQEIDAFNVKNRWRKRGIGMAIMDYDITYIGEFPATVAIYHGDGSVAITHSGIELGQGLNTKAAQVAAFFLGVPLSFIKVEPSNTVDGANAFVTGNNVGSESVCFAVRKACQTLNARLQPVRDALGKKATWPEVVQNAYSRGILLVANEQLHRSDLQPYSVYGLSLAEIEIDILTGTHQIRRVDILEDVGESLSPAIDVGQVEGAFVMSLGYWLTEHLIYDRQTGELLTNRTWNYKVPGAKDIPIDFRIELLRNSANAGGFMRSKAIGEPPSCLAVCVIFAIQHALQSARSDAGLKRRWIRLGAPTTPETIVLNAGSDIRTFCLE